jgi:hypothetical protein
METNAYHGQLFTAVTVLFDSGGYGRRNVICPGFWENARKKFVEKLMLLS